VRWDRFALPAVGAGVFAASTAAVFIRLADAPALSIAFWRTGLAVVILLPFLLYRRERLPRGRNLGICAVSGVALGAHFGFWISSLDYTSVAASAVLVATQPVFVAVLAHLVLGEKTSLVSGAGILLALAGTALIATDSSAGETAFLGNVLALSPSTS
jgi:drug/metabolite transporter (DMT)-like permease